MAWGPARVQRLLEVHGAAKQELGKLQECIGSMDEQVCGKVMAWLWCFVRVPRGWRAPWGWRVPGAGGLCFDQFVQVLAVQRAWVGGGAR